ncbi:MAG: HTH domain-containing protein [Bacteroidota bacterium]
MLKRSHLSEKTCREIIQLFSEDLTATQIAGITNVSRVTINNYLKLIRTHIAKHCEEQVPGEFHRTRPEHVAQQPAHRASASEDYNVYFGFYKENGNIFTEELHAIDKSDIRALQQAVMLHSQQSTDTVDLVRYHAIADFDEWRLYRVDTAAANGKNYHDDIALFWGNTRNRLLKFRGLNKNTLYLHVKESEFRYNYRQDDINRLLLNIIYKYPLHLSKAYV